MKAIIAYALVVLGVPVLVGLLFGSIVSLPIIMVLRRSTNISMSSFLYFEAFHGFGAMLAAALLFHLFSVQMSIAVLIIMAVWVTLYFLSYGQPRRALFSSLTGMIVGWFVIPQMFGL
jgi:hypothetical protein